jgi:hypothetical protein
VPVCLSWPRSDPQPMVGRFISRVRDVLTGSDD